MYFGKQRVEVFAPINNHYDPNALASLNKGHGDRDMSARP